MAKLTACSHERALFHPATRKLIINDLLDFLTPKADEFEAIAISGYSSAMVSPTVADMLGKNLILIRKPSDDHHSGWQNEGIHGQRCIFIDDLIGEGNTVRRVKNGVEHIGGKLVAVTLYQNRTQSSRDLPPGFYGVEFWPMPAKTEAYKQIEERTIFSSSFS